VRTPSAENEPTAQAVCSAAIGRVFGVVCANGCSNGVKPLVRFLAGQRAPAPPRAPKRTGPPADIPQADLMGGAGCDRHGCCARWPA
jgi:hypothetical protein